MTTTKLIYIFIPSNGPYRTRFKKKKNTLEVSERMEFKWLKMEFVTVNIFRDHL